MTNEMIQVPRRELLAWAKAWESAYGPGDGTDCVTPFDKYLYGTSYRITVDPDTGVVSGAREKQRCTCPSGDGSLRWPCPAHPPEAQAQAQGGGEVFGWVLGDAFVDARYWTADAPPLGWTPVYCTAPPSAPVGVPSDILRIVDTAIDVCNDRDRPAMAEDLEAVRLYVEQASAALAQQQATPKGEGCASCGDLADFLDEGGLCASCWCAQEPLDALGLMEKVGRGKWAPTKAAKRFVTVARTSPPAESAPFVVKHYTGEEGPTIKGNGFDGLRLGEDREEAEEFVRWINTRLAQQPAAVGEAADHIAALRELYATRNPVGRFARAIKAGIAALAAQPGGSDNE